jgi:hypothetical protein
MRKYGRLNRVLQVRDFAAPEQQCSRCGERATRDQFQVGRALQSWCRGCRNEAKRNLRRDRGATPRAERSAITQERLRAKRAAVAERKAQRDADKEARATSGLARCRICGTEKQRAVFFWSEGCCRDCEKARFKRWVAEGDERYVRRLMAKTSPVLKGSDIPLSLVQAKQMQLRILRYINEMEERT